MTILNQQQRERAMELMQQYLHAPPNHEGKTPTEAGTSWDENRVVAIEQTLQPLVLRYLTGGLPLPEFKSQIDSCGKRFPLWGFKGIKGQMFFNMVVNVASDLDECDQEIKSALAAPENDQIAGSRIRTFSSYARRLGEQSEEAGQSRYRSPKIGSIPFFLSYFWQIEDRFRWPVYYTNSVKVMSDSNIWQASGDLAEDYLSFKRIHEELAQLFSDVSGQPFDFYRVEHVFWYRDNNPFLNQKDGNGGAIRIPIDETQILSEGWLLPESYLPPIIAILPRMASNEEELVQAAKRSGTTLERAFEKFVDAAFTTMGYETKLLGQGQGRVPDGLAMAPDDNYAVLWDAKVRGKGYSMGTDDRTIREYITTQSRELKRRRFIRNIYYAIVSSRFADDYDDLIRSIKMETDVNEVCLLEADALVAMVDAKLRSPLQITLGPDGIQRLFTVSGILNADMVREQLM
jgi:hypothetical protein